jgi:hypothetical protein
MVIHTDILKYNSYHIRNRPDVTFSYHIRNRPVVRLSYHIRNRPVVTFYIQSQYMT